MKKYIVLGIVLMCTSIGGIAQENTSVQLNQNVTLSYGFADKFNMLRLS